MALKGYYFTVGVYDLAFAFDVTRGIWRGRVSASSGHNIIIFATRSCFTPLIAARCDEDIKTERRIYHCIYFLTQMNPKGVHVLVQLYYSSEVLQS